MALWGAKRLEQGRLVAVQGYLTQHMRGDGALSVEVTADEFLPANKGSAREQTSPAKRMDGAMKTRRCTARRRKANLRSRMKRWL